MQETVEEISYKDDKHFSGKELMKIITELFGNSPDCGDIKVFINENKELLKKTMKNNKYGMDFGSSAFHILAKKNFNSTITTAYKLQFGMFRDIQSDVRKTIKCIYENIDDADFIKSLHEINILEKLANNKTALEVAKEEPANNELIAIFEKIKELQLNPREQTEKPKIEEVIDEVNNDNVEEAHNKNDILIFRFNKNVIVSENKTPTKKVIRIRSKKNAIDKGYKITRVKAKVPTKEKLDGGKKSRTASRKKTQKRKTAKK